MDAELLSAVQAYLGRHLLPCGLSGALDPQRAQEKQHPAGGGSFRGGTLVFKKAVIKLENAFEFQGCLEPKTGIENGGSLQLMLTC